MKVITIAGTATKDGEVKEGEWTKLDSVRSR